MQPVKITTEIKIERLQAQLEFCLKNEPWRKDKAEELKKMIEELNEKKETQ